MSACEWCGADGSAGDNARCVLDGEWHAWAGPIVREAWEREVGD